MKRRSPRKTKPSWLSIILIVAAISIWALDQKRGSTTRDSPPAPSRESSPAFEHHRACTLVNARNNDGDSFMVRLPDGRQVEFRLYFVDTPESAFKRYSGGHTNHDRIADQAAEMGGITPEQAVAIGKKAKTLTLGLLGSQPFDIFTSWDSPFQDNRFHAFVRVSENGNPRWLHELLIENGLARIKTKPADLPDGTPADHQLGHLRQLERSARNNKSGAWGL